MLVVPEWLHTMVLTRDQSKNALELLVVFGLTATDPLMLALEADQIEDIEVFLSSVTYSTTD